MNTAGIHGSAFVWGDRGILVCGPSGSGKSSFVWHAFNHLPGHTALVADDRVSLRSVGTSVLASGFESLAGQLEVAGKGILSLSHIVETRLDLIVELHHELTRMPEPRYDPELGLPVLVSPPRDATRACALLAAWFVAQ